MLEAKIIKLVSDSIFKSVMSNINCRKALCLFISEVCNIDYEDIIDNIFVTNSEHMIIKINEKRKRSDLIVESGNCVFIIEVNRGHYYDGLFIKNYAYANEVNLRSIEIGMDYSKSKEIYLINIDEFDFFKCNSLVVDFPRYNKENNVSERINIHDKHVILENVEKDKYNKYSDSFIRLIKIMTCDEKNKLLELSKGDEILENVTKKIIDLQEEVDTIGLYDYEERQQMILNTVKSSALREGLEQGLEQGHKQGLSEGHKQGLSEGLNKVAKNMLKLGMRIEEISKATGLSINQIKML